MRIKYNDKDLLQLEEINIHYGRRYCKRGNTNLLSGFTSEFLEELDNIGGIESISYSAYESERKWFWDNQDYHKMGLDMISPDMSNSRDTPITDYGYRYIFSTEYVNPTKELYKKLENILIKSTETMMISSMADRLWYSYRMHLMEAMMIRLKQEIHLITIIMNCR